MPVPKYDKLTLTFAEAISQFEGYHDYGTVARTNNNPGNLRSWGSAPIHKGFAAFQTAREGWEALYTQVYKNLYDRNLSINEFFEGKEGVYAGYLGKEAPSAEVKKYTDYIHIYLQDRGFYPISKLTVLAQWYKKEQWNDVFESEPSEPNSTTSTVKGTLVRYKEMDRYGLVVGKERLVDLGNSHHMGEDWKPLGD